MTSPARPSATVVLIRDADTEPEILFVRRHARTSFGAAYVFPGGVVDTSQDQSIGAAHRDLDEQSASRVLKLESGGLAYFSAAIRELFEETGVLLARTDDGRWADAQALAEYRAPLNEHRASWSEFLQRFRLRLTCSALRYCSFWITPAQAPKRFSTRFFLAELPSGQSAAHCGTELTDSVWRSAQSALDTSAAGEMELPFPTAMTLKTLADKQSVTELMEWATAQAAAGVRPIQPAIVRSGGDSRVAMPGDKDYPEPDARGMEFTSD